MPKLSLPNHAPGGQTVVTGLSAMNLQSSSGAGSSRQGGPGFPSYFYRVREMYPWWSFRDSGFYFRSYAR